MSHRLWFHMNAQIICPVMFSVSDYHAFHLQSTCQLRHLQSTVGDICTQGSNHSEQRSIIIHVQKVLYLNSQ